MLIWLLRRFKKLKRFTERHNSKFSALILLFFVITIGSFGFYHFEKNQGQVDSIWDAAYWVIVTITTVGFGDISPQTQGGRIIFIFVALGGIGAIAYVIQEVVTFSARSQFEKLLGLKIIKMENHTIIVGWNSKTEEAIKELNNTDEKFLVIGDRDSQEELSTKDFKYIIGDPTKDETLNRANINSAKTLMLPLEDDSEIIMISLMARKLNNKIKIVAICNSREHMGIMKEAGIEHIISHTEIGARLLTHIITEPIIVKFIMNATTASVEGVELKQEKIDKSKKIKELRLKENEKLIAIHRDDKFILDFDKNFLLNKGDILVIVCPFL